jgi:hypothetical protein
MRHPFHIYVNNNGNVCVMVCEVPIFNLGAHSVLNTVVIWAKNIGGSALFRDYIGAQKRYADGTKDCLIRFLDWRPIERDYLIV